MEQFGDKEVEVVGESSGRGRIQVARRFRISEDWMRNEATKKKKKKQQFNICMSSKDCC